MNISFEFHIFFTDFTIIVTLPENVATKKDVSVKLTDVTISGDNRVIVKPANKDPVISFEHILSFEIHNI